MSFNLLGMGFQALMAGDVDKAAEVFSQFGSPAQGDQMLKLAQMQNPITYPGAGSITPQQAQPNTTLSPQAEVELQRQRDILAAEAGTSNPNPVHKGGGTGGVPFQDTGLGKYFASEGTVSPGRGYKPQPPTAEEITAAAGQQDVTAFAPGPTTDPTVAAAKKVQAMPVNTQPAVSPQTAPNALAAGLGGAQMPGTSPEDALLASLGAIQAPPGKKIPNPPSVVSPSRGTQVSPTVARMLLQMLTPGANPLPSFASLMR